MLDYILSKVVLLGFLVMVAAFILMYQDQLVNTFLSRSASAIAENVGEKIRTVASNYYIVAETSCIRPEPYMSILNQKVPYKLVLSCKKEGDAYYIGVGVKTSDKMIAAHVLKLVPPPGKTLTIGSVGGRDKLEVDSTREVIIVDKSVSIDEVSVRIKKADRCRGGNEVYLTC